MEENHSTLLGIVTYDGHRYAFPELQKALRAVQAQTPAAVDIIFADNSATDDYAQEIRKAGFPVIKDNAGGTRIERIIRGRNKLREWALRGNYAHLCFIDSDVIPPQDTLRRLLSHNKDIVLGVYLSHVQLDVGVRFTPVLYDFHPKPGFIRPMRIEEVRDNHFLEVMGGGLGCALIRCDVLRRLPSFHNIRANEDGGEDVAFFKDARDAGYKIYTDTSVKCFHMRFPPGDQRNETYQFRKKEAKKAEAPKMAGDFSF